MKCKYAAVVFELLCIAVLLPVYEERRAPSRYICLNSGVFRGCEMSCLDIDLYDYSR